MATHHTCDRCGEPTETTKLGGNTYVSHRITKRDKPSRWIDPIKYKMREIDLCKGCDDALAAWLDELKEKSDG